VVLKFKFGWCNRPWVFFLSPNQQCEALKDQRDWISHKPNWWHTSASKF